MKPLLCVLFGHDTIRETHTDKLGYKDRVLVCSRCGYSELAIKRTADEVSAIVCRYRTKPAHELMKARAK